MTKRGPLAALLKSRKSGGSRHAKASKPSNSSIQLEEVDIPIDGSDAYASLVAGLRSRSVALKRRRLEEEGMEEEIFSDEDDEDAEKDRGQSKDTMQAHHKKDPRAIDSWSREAIKSNVLLLDEGNEGKKAEALDEEEAPASTKDVLGLDTWSYHFERELDDEAAEKQLAEKLLTPSDCPSAYKAAFPNISWQVSPGLSTNSNNESLLPDLPSSLSALGVKERLRNRWLEVLQEDAAKSPASLNHDEGRVGDFSSDRQRLLFSSLNNYSDLIFPCHPYPRVDPSSPSASHDEVTDAYLLHSLNHVAKTGDRIKKNNDQIEATAARAAKEAAEATKDAEAKNEGGNKGKSKGKKDASAPAKAPRSHHFSFDSLPRDQGFTRPKVLILLPQRNLAFHVIRRLVNLAMKETRSDSVQGKEKFVEQFTLDEDEDEDMTDEKAKARRALKPPDWRGLFTGNLDDHFRIGVRITR